LSLVSWVLVRDFMLAGVVVILSRCWY